MDFVLRRLSNFKLLGNLFSSLSSRPGIQYGMLVWVAIMHGLSIGFLLYLLSAIDLSAALASGIPDATILVLYGNTFKLVILLPLLFEEIFSFFIKSAKIFELMTKTRLQSLEVSKSLECFISYSRKDFWVADKLYHDLNDRGYKAWMDIYDIQPGADWEESISKGIRESDVYILLISSWSLRSEIVVSEFKDALAAQKQFVLIWVQTPLLADWKKLLPEINNLNWIDRLNKNNLKRILQQKIDKLYLVDSRLMPLKMAAEVLNELEHKTNSGRWPVFSFKWINFRLAFDLLPMEVYLFGLWKVFYLVVNAAVKLVLALISYKLYRVYQRADASESILLEIFLALLLISLILIINDILETRSIIKGHFYKNDNFISRTKSILGELTELLLGIAIIVVTMYTSIYFGSLNTNMLIGLALASLGLMMLALIRISLKVESNKLGVIKLWNSGYDQKSSFSKSSRKVVDLPLKIEQIPLQGKPFEEIMILSANHDRGLAEYIRDSISERFNLVEQVTHNTDCVIVLLSPKVSGDQTVQQTLEIMRNAVRPPTILLALIEDVVPAGRLQKMNWLDFRGDLTVAVDRLKDILAGKKPQFTTNEINVNPQTQNVVRFPKNGEYTVYAMLVTTMFWAINIPSILALFHSTYYQPSVKDYMWLFLFIVVTVLNTAALGFLIDRNISLNLLIWFYAIQIFGGILFLISYGNDMALWLGVINDIGDLINFFNWVALLSGILTVLFVLSSKQLYSWLPRGLYLGLSRISIYWMSTILLLFGLGGAILYFVLY